MIKRINKGGFKCYMNKTQNIHNCKRFIDLRILFGIYNIKNTIMYYFYNI